MKDLKSTKLSSQQLNHQQLQQQHHQNGGHLSPFKLTKLLDPDASWDKDQLGDVLHWIRQVVGLVCGLLCGAIPLVGGIWILVFLLISSVIIYGYYAVILKIDEEEFGGHGVLLQEGLFASITLFLEKNGGLRSIFANQLLHPSQQVRRMSELSAFFGEMSRFQAVRGFRVDSLQGPMWRQETAGKNLNPLSSWHCMF